MNFYLKLIIIPLLVGLFSNLGWFGFGCTVVMMCVIAYIEEKALL